MGRTLSAERYTMVYAAGPIQLRLILRVRTLQQCHRQWDKQANRLRHTVAARYTVSLQVGAC